MMKKLMVSLATLALLTACGGGDASPTTTEVAGEATPATSPAQPVSTATEDASAEPMEEEAPEVVEQEQEGPVEGEDLDLPTWSAADGPATWVCAEVDYEGAPVPTAPVFRFTVPTDESHEAVQAMETLRAAYGIEEKPNYIVVEIDATKIDQQSANVASLEWATLDQNSQSAESAWMLVSEWQDQVIDDANLYNEGVDVYNMLLETSPNRGAKGYDLLIADGPLESMVAPYVFAGGMTMALCELE